MTPLHEFGIIMFAQVTVITFDYGLALCRRWSACDGPAYDWDLGTLACTCQSGARLDIATARVVGRVDLAAAQRAIAGTGCRFTSAARSSDRWNDRRDRSARVGRIRTAP